MREQFLREKDPLTEPQGLLHNTGYGRRSYPKTDKISSNYFETGISAVRNDIILYAALRIPEAENDIEAWLLKMVFQLGYNSWDEIEPFLNLPPEAAVLFDRQEKKEAVYPTDLFETVRKAVILSRCGPVTYEPGSPMIFSKKRISRPVTLVTINIKSFYELD
jgi:hypothetical protein